MGVNKLVAIHQPNFFPWLGYFDKLARADVFILLDDAQFPKTGGTWINRVQLAVGGKPAWVTAPIVRAYHGLRRIDEMELNNTTPWREKLIKTLQMNYARAPFYDAVFPFIAGLIGSPTDRLVEYNIPAMRALADAIRLQNEKIVLASSLHVEDSATDRLVHLVRAVDGDAYLAGGGAAGYQEDEKFDQAGIAVISQNFRHPVYAQSSTSQFIPGLSTIDALFNLGFEGVHSLLPARRVALQS